ncbi:MAG: alpha/beta fold hydrolase [Simkaniaceae bacterium]|nr:alpha/beta fold hydrolase [Simkaniaceae bacterium]
MEENNYFKPFPLLSGYHGQTILGSLLNIGLFLSSKTEYVELPDKDEIAVEVSTPKRWKPDKPTVVLLHGLCGSHRSPYLVRLVKKLMRRGIQSVRMNLRGCGSGRGHARNFYHCGSSPDIIAVLEYMKKKYPDSPLILIGYSLGGHLVLKTAGELGDRGPELLEQVISVSPPVNLITSMRLLSNPKNRMYERYFLRHLLDSIYDLHALFPDLPPVSLPPDLTVFDFDELYVAPRLGFRSAFEYYKNCSSLPLIPNIRIPTHILFSKDDPIIDPHDIDTVKLPNCVEVTKTDHGGHLGFLGAPGTQHGFRWLDSMLLKWIKATLSN